MDGIGEFAHAGGNKAVLEVHPVAEGFSGHAEGAVVVALVDEVLRGQTVAVFGVEGLHGFDRDGCGVPEPVNVLFFALVIEYQGEVVEERGEADDVNFRVFAEPAVKF